MFKLARHSIRRQFALLTEPVDYQLSVHYANIEAFYGSHSFVSQLEQCILTPILGSIDYRVMTSLVAHYGVERMERWLVEMKIDQTYRKSYNPGVKRP